MKKIMLKVLAAVMAAWMVAYQASAVVVVYSIPAGAAWNATNLFGLTNGLQGAVINSVKLDTGTSGGVTNLTYALLDFPGVNAPYGWGGIYQTNTGYMQVSSYLTNLTKITTNFTGVTFTNTFTNALYTYTNYVGQTSNLWKRIASGTVGSNSSVTITGPFIVVYGLGYTNNNIGVNATITVDYDPSL